MKLKFESGRSMVEMLGVLAIVGVLSIGGIMGYSYAMDKYRASVTLDDVNLRMIDVMQQVYKNKTEIMIPEDWDLRGRAGYLIDLFQNNELEPSIMVEGVPSSVCKLILKGSLETQDIFVGVLNGENLDGNWYSGVNEEICDGGDKEIVFALNQDVLNAYNPDNVGEYTEVLSTAQLECYSNFDCNLNKPYCSSNGECVECTQNSHCPDNTPTCLISLGLCVSSCTSNEQCDDDEYCASQNSSSVEAFPEDNPGICKPLSFTEGGILNTTNKTIHYSNEGMSYWEAELACEKMGMSVINADDAGYNPSVGLGDITIDTGNYCDYGIGQYGVPFMFANNGTPVEYLVGPMYPQTIEISKDVPRCTACVK